MYSPVSTISTSIVRPASVEAATLAMFCHGSGRCCTCCSKASARPPGGLRGEPLLQHVPRLRHLSAQRLQLLGQRITQQPDGAEQKQQCARRDHGHRQGAGQTRVALQRIGHGAQRGGQQHGAEQCQQWFAQQPQQHQQHRCRGQAPKHRSELCAGHAFRLTVRNGRRARGGRREAANEVGAAAGRQGLCMSLSRQTTHPGRVETRPRGAGCCARPPARRPPAGTTRPSAR